MTRIKILTFFLFTITAFLNQANAQVGIGTDTPTNTLHVKPVDANEDPLRIENINQIVQGDSAFLVVDPTTGVIRFMEINNLLDHVNFTVDTSVTNELQDASQVPLSPFIDLDGNGFIEQNVQEAIELLADRLPKGTYKSVGEARDAGLENGDAFYTHPQGVFGCSGCIVTLYEGMN